MIIKIRPNLLTFGRFICYRHSHKLCGNGLLCQIMQTELTHRWIKRDNIQGLKVSSTLCQPVPNVNLTISKWLFYTFTFCMVQTIAVVFDRGGHGKLNKFYPRFNLNKTRLNFKEFSLEIPNTKFSVGSIVEHWGG